MTESALTIIVFYSCHECALVKAPCRVHARGDEDMAVWMKATIMQIGLDHERRSPGCGARLLHDLMIPVSHADRIGGPVMQ